VQLWRKAGRVAGYRPVVPLPPDGRRAEEARATRAAIIASARRLFAEQGYFATKVEEIARVAGVAPATVYAVCGGKQGLVSSLVEQWPSAPEVLRVLSEIARAASVEQVIEQLSDAVHRGRADWGDIARFVLTTAPHDAAVAEGLALAQQRYLAALATCAERVVHVHGGGDVEEVTLVLWFHFGFRAFAALVQDFGWEPDRAQVWLAGKALAAVLDCLPQNASGR